LFLVLAAAKLLVMRPLPCANENKRKFRFRWRVGAGACSADFVIFTKTGRREKRSSSLTMSERIFIYPFAFLCVALLSSAYFHWANTPNILPDFIVPG
jgi:hypothetical protein